MLFLTLSALTAAATQLTEDVSRGWYLWETGRDAEAATLSKKLIRKHPDALPAVGLYAAMQVEASRGASIEATYREVFSQDPADPQGRVALAYAITFRHDAAATYKRANGVPWCDEVEDLLKTVVDGEEHAWAVIAEREAEVRCRGTTSHADAELVRLSRNVNSPVWADGILARADAGYIRPELAELIEVMWGLYPDRLDRAPELFKQSASGPARGRARRVTKKALAFAAESSEPTWVWATIKAYRELGWEAEANEAQAHLLRLDPEAKLDLNRDRHTIHDPEAYGEIDACFAQPSETDIRTCSEALPETDVPAVAAYLHYRRFLALRAFGDEGAALKQAMAAHRAEPNLVSYARAVVVGALALKAFDETTETVGRSAVDSLLATPPDTEEMTSTRARRWSRDLELGARLMERLGNVSRAADLYRRSFTLDPTAPRRLRLGIALADAKQPAAAVLHLTRGIVEAMDEPELIRRARQRLDSLAPLWGRTNANAILREAIGGKGNANPLLGEVLDADTWGWPELTSKPAVRLVVVWGELFEPRGHRHEILRNVNAYAAQNKDVSAVALDVGIRKATWPGGVRMPHFSGGPLPAQSLQLVTLPTVLVLDGDERLKAVLSPFGHDDDATVELVDAVDAVREAP
ncbi:MAG: hypothetical protein AAGA48_37845 [Myxococcota bacterium]